MTPPVAASTTRKQAQRRTRAAILDRAVNLASTDGLEGLTIGRLAGELEMSKSGLFGHFGSKGEPQLATVPHPPRRFIAEVVAPAARTTADGSERLRALVEGYLDHLAGEVFPG